MDRREFFKYSAGAALSLSMLGRAADVFAKSSPEDKYSVVILGDTHYDVKDPEVYHAGYHLANTERENNHRKEFKRNGEMWEQRCPALVKRAACLVDDDTRFVLQMGDLVQGDTATAAIHTRFLDDAMGLLKTGLALDLPLVTVAGNHDLRGNDDAVITQAYNDYMPARLSQELGIDVPGTDFLFNCGPDAYLVINFGKTTLEKVEKLFDASKDARHTFVVVHSPVFPYDSAKYWWWILFGNRQDSRAEERRYARRLMASRNAVVLCGHTHKTELLDWYGDGGRITQMTMSSVWANESQGKYKVLASGADGYGSRSKFENEDAAKRLFEEYRPGILRYTCANAAGSYKLVVKDEDIHVEFYAGNSPYLSECFYLRT